MIPGPILIILLPLVMTYFVYILRRWERMAALLAICTTLSLFCLYLPLEELIGWQVAIGKPATILGRELAVTPLGRVALAFISIVFTVSFLFACGVSRDWSFFPVGLLILTLLNAAITIRHPLFPALFLWIATVLAVFILQSRMPSTEVEVKASRRALDSTKGAIRYLIMTTLAIPFYLAAVWLFELHELNPDDVGIAIRAVELMVLSFGIFLAVVPFHAWVPALSSNASPSIFSLVLSNISAVTLFLLLDIFQLHPWLVEDGRIFKMMRVGGLLTAALSGALALSQSDFGRLLGYASLGDMGCILIALGTAYHSGLGAAFFQFAGRSLALLLAGMSLELMRRRVGGDSFAELRGIGRSLPLATFGLILGGLSLAGFPFTLGFVTRWVIFRLIGDLKWILLWNSCGVALGFLRGLFSLISPITSTKHEREPLMASLIILVAIALCLFLGLYPQFLLQVLPDT